MIIISSLKMVRPRRRKLSLFLQNLKAQILSKINHVFDHLMKNLRLEMSSEDRELTEYKFWNFSGQVMNFPAKVSPEKMTAGGGGRIWAHG